jgi:hypothetical protein
MGVRFLLLLLTLVVAHGAPSLPQYFQMTWKIYAVNNNSAPPPYKPTPPVPYDTGFGLTYYDWTRHSMKEVYKTFCVPIFPQGNKWPCVFLNTNNVSYLISQNSPFSPCCIFMKPFSPPAPNFLDVAKLPFNQTISLYGKLVDFWVLDGDDPAEPFGYGFYRDRIGTQRIPAVFWFRSEGGWTSQEFHDFVMRRPTEREWDVPTECVNAPSCGFSTRFR